MFQKKSTLSKEQQKQAARALELLFTTGYINKRALYLENFIRGLFFSAGSVIGATIIIAVIVWFLSFFGEVPVVGPVFREAQQSLQQTK